MLTAFWFKKNSSSSSKPCEKIKAEGGKMCKIAGDFYIDVNGLKKTNKLGRDIFYFYLSDDGNIYPYGSKDVAIYIVAKHLLWNTYHKYCGLSEGSGTILGNGCAARIMGEGWQMNY